MPTATKDAEIKFRTSDELKRQTRRVYDRWGLTLSEALNLFMRKSVEVGGLPFDLRPEPSPVLTAGRRCARIPPRASPSFRPGWTPQRTRGSTMTSCDPAPRDIWARLRRVRRPRRRGQGATRCHLGRFGKGERHYREGNDVGKLRTVRFRRDLRLGILRTPSALLGASRAPCGGASRQAFEGRTARATVPFDLRACLCCAGFGQSASLTRT